MGALILLMAIAVYITAGLIVVTVSLSWRQRNRFHLIKNDDDLDFTLIMLIWPAALVMFVCYSPEKEAEKAERRRTESERKYYGRSGS